MSSSDDYHRHRSRTATKYFKVSVKPFQRLGRVRGGSPGNGLAECEAEPHKKQSSSVGIFISRFSRKDFIKEGLNTYTCGFLDAFDYLVSTIHYVLNHFC